MEERSCCHRCRRSACSCCAAASGGCGRAASRACRRRSWAVLSTWSCNAAKNSCKPCTRATGSAMAASRSSCAARAALSVSSAMPASQGGQRTGGDGCGRAPRCTRSRRGFASLDEAYTLRTLPEGRQLTYTVCGASAWLTSRSYDNAETPRPRDPAPFGPRRAPPRPYVAT